MKFLHSPRCCDCRGVFVIPLEFFWEGENTDDLLSQKTCLEALSLFCVETGEVYLFCVPNAVAVYQQMRATQIRLNLLSRCL